jgi:hypothetical protein
MAITRAEANQIAESIAPIFQQVLDEYDFKKYPAADYSRLKISFSALTASHADIKDALVWKWGHWGKSNYPQHHRDLIAEVQDLWPSFVTSGFSNTSARTFEWWHSHIDRKTAYITVAFITHLVHHNEPLPIIDQHNFRAMNSLVGCLRRGNKPKRKPSNWNDIEILKSFMTQVTGALSGRHFSEVDRFLMMYGRNYVAR